MSIYNTAKKTYMHNMIAYACIVCLMMIDIDLMHLRYKRVQARGLCVWLVIADW
jgi:hypothetical protein